MRIDTEIKLDFCDVLLRPMTSTLTSRAEVDLEREFKFRHSGRILKCIPIIAANMDTVGTFEMALALSKHKMLTALHKFYTIEQLQEFFATHSPNKELADFVMYTTGIRESDLEKLKEAKDSGLTEQFNNIVVDVPNGYIQTFGETVKNIRKMFPNHTIFAGNVVTSDITEHLIQNCGVDVAKIGIGPGKVCKTRLQTGVGYSQFSAIMETSNSAHGVKGFICGDGGLRSPGDLMKSFGGGSDFSMVGYMFSGHDECGGEIVEVDGSKKMKFYGMSSEEAMMKHYGEVAKHRASEGETIYVDYKGPVENTILEILGGLRSGASYIGAERMKEIHKRASFIRVTRQHD